MEETMTGAAVKKLLTYSGLKKLEEELERLKVVERKEIAQKIKEAREHGHEAQNEATFTTEVNAATCGEAEACKCDTCPCCGCKIVH